MCLLTPLLPSPLCSNHTSPCMIFRMLLACFLLWETLFAVLTALKMLWSQSLQQAPSYYSITQVSTQISLSQKAPIHWNQSSSSNDLLSHHASSQYYCYLNYIVYVFSSLQFKLREAWFCLSHYCISQVRIMLGKTDQNFCENKWWHCRTHLQHKPKVVRDIHMP